MNIPDLLHPADVHLDVELTNKKDVLKFLSERVSEKCGLRAGECRQALASRERLGATTIGSGVAFPHAQLEGLDAPLAILLRLSQPVDFALPGEEPVDVIVMLVTPTGATREHLEGLSAFARVLRSPDTLRSVRGAESSAHVVASLTRQP